MKANLRRLQLVTGLGVLIALCVSTWAADYAVSGTLEKWATVTIDFQGPAHSAKDNDPNPFLDYRLAVRFTGPCGRTYDVPGFFDGDGAGGLTGNVWRVRFSPDGLGQWQFRASFRKGPAVAVSLDAEAGEAASFDGCEGSFVIKAANEQAPGFLRLGRLQYVGEHYLKFADGPYWIKGGTDSPEDFLAYRGFDNTISGRRGGHSYAPHVRDWTEGDPDWGDGKGKGIIGALNYLASAQVNSIYFLPMNIGGDGGNTWPYLGRIDTSGDPGNDNLHFDLGKLRQWEIVFAHAQRKGIFLHFVLNEGERGNKRELDNTKLGVERKLYYRELAARFGHHLAMQWNLCEEYNHNNLQAKQVKQWAGYLHDVDPYDHPITVHHSSTPEKTWTPFLGDPLFTMTSFQTKSSRTVEDWRRKSVAAGVPLVIGMDEFWPDTARASNADRHRREYIWPIYLSGGNIEFILKDLLGTEDFRRYEAHWAYMWHARKFVQEHLPFWEMKPMDELLSGAPEYRGKNLTIQGQVFAKPGEVYAVYMPTAKSTATLDLSADKGAFVMRWYNPRTGEFVGETRKVEGGKSVELGPAPSEASEDWAVLVTRC